MTKAELKRRVLYLAGPMSGLPEFNHPAFHNMAKRLRERGYTVINPAEFDDLGNPEEWEEYLRRDLAIIAATRVSGLVMLDGWDTSKGVMEIELPVSMGFRWPVVMADDALIASFMSPVIPEVSRHVLWAARDRWRLTHESQDKAQAAEAGA